jgi:Dyp-type peroxidase family
MRDLHPILSDVQTGVLRSIDPHVVAYLFFRIVNRREFLDALPPNDHRPLELGIGLTHFYSEAVHLQFLDGCKDAPLFEAYANVAFTYTGLEALGVHERTLASFPEPFREGMAARALLLGDEGECAPQRWDGYLGSREVHGVISRSLHFARPTTDFLWAYHRLILGTLEAMPTSWVPAGFEPEALSLTNGGDVSEQQVKKFDVVEVPGAEVLHVEFGKANYRVGANAVPYRVEHFGYRDGVSQPYTDIGLAPPPPGGGTPRGDDGWAPLALGEVLLGHQDEDGLLQHLPANRCLRTNGSYMVLRKLEQDVVGFRNFLKRNERSGEDGLLGAQMIGRWPDGAPLVKYPNGPEADFGKPKTASALEANINDFRYQRDDPYGRRCPIGAHIRRANPRDTNNRDEAHRHRLFRRGISYGGNLLPEDSPGDGQTRGLLFIAMQARLDRQFEFVQSNWLNQGEFAGQAGARRDPLTGAHAGRLSDAFQPAGEPAPVTHLQRFVAMRGGDYFFVPSFAALAKFKENGNFAPDDPDAPVPEDALGYIQPARTDNSAELIALGKRLLAAGQPSFAPLPPVTTSAFPGGPSVEIRTIVVGRHEYVKNVLMDANREFSSALLDQRARRIAGGARLLIGLEQGDPERKKRLDFLHQGLSMLGPLSVATITEGLTQAALARVLPLGRLDVVEDFGRVVPILCAGALFGVTGPNFVSPTGIAALFGRTDVTDFPEDWLRTLPPIEDYAKPLASMQTWTRLAFLQIFINTVNAEEIAAAAERAVSEFLRRIDQLIFQARQTRHSGNPRNLLEALVRVPLDPTDQPNPERHIRLILAEFTAGAVETVNTALANLVNYLLDHRDEVRDAIRLRMNCRAPTDHDVLFNQMADPDLDILINEVLRFEPVGPLAFRNCIKEKTKIGGADVDPGTVVCLVPAAAMVDDRVFPEPDAIRFDRPAENYLHFGAGIHRCAGQWIVDPIVFPIALPMIRVMFRKLASLPQLRRAAGPTGRKAQTYPMLVDSLTIRFTPG